MTRVAYVDFSLEPKDRTGDSMNQIRKTKKRLKEKSVEERQRE